MEIAIEEPYGSQPTLQLGITLQFDDVDKFPTIFSEMHPCKTAMIDAIETCEATNNATSKPCKVVKNVVAKPCQDGGKSFVLPTNLDNMDAVKPLVTRMHHKEGVQKLLESKDYLEVWAIILDDHEDNESNIEGNDGFWKRQHDEIVQVELGVINEGGN